MNITRLELINVIVFLRLSQLQIQKPINEGFLCMFLQGPN